MAQDPTRVDTGAGIPTGLIGGLIGGTLGGALGYAVSKGGCERPDCGASADAVVSLAVVGLLIGVGIEALARR